MAHQTRQPHQGRGPAFVSRLPFRILAPSEEMLSASTSCPRCMASPETTYFRALSRRPRKGTNLAAQSFLPLNSGSQAPSRFFSGTSPLKMETWKQQLDDESPCTQESLNPSDVSHPHPSPPRSTLPALLQASLLRQLPSDWC